jgi:hypothetical protein
MNSKAMIVPALFSLLLAGCATTVQTRHVRPSGFLSDYSQLRPGTGDEAQLVWISRTADFGAYRSVLVDPITIRCPRETMQDVPAEEMQNLANELHQTITQALQEDYALVDHAGPQTMRLRVAITDVDPSRPAADLVSTVVPFARAVSAARRLATGTSSFVGQAAVEAEMVDSVSGERLMAAVDERAGGKVLRGSLREWSDVEESFDFWANRLRDRLRELRNR